ncbi:MAG TPA: DUF4390 domain-containing protein [Methylomirabilota bacterium]|jgi:hypothetical protein|nr:DUF4390 domain-containing protein [Methylomirabilota bacterium]
MRRSTILTRSTRPRVIALVALLLLLLCLPPAVSRAQSDLRITGLSVFLNDFDVTVQGVLLGAVPADLHESLHSGVPVHVRFVVELWQQRFRNRLIQSRTIDRQLTYNPATKEYKVASTAGEERELFVSKQLREAQRVVSELRVGKLAPDASLDPRELYFVRLRAAVSLNGVNTWLARFNGEAAETDWVQSPLLTPTRRQ